MGRFRRFSTNLGIKITTGAEFALENPRSHQCDGGVTEFVTLIMERGWFPLGIATRGRSAGCDVRVFFTTECFF